MFFPRIFWLVVAGLIPAAMVCNATGTSAPISTAPVYVPDTSHANEPMPDGILAWNAVMQTAEATNGQDFARFAVKPGSNLASEYFVLEAQHNLSLQLRRRPDCVVAESGKVAIAFLSTAFGNRLRDLARCANSLRPNSW